MSCGEERAAFEGRVVGSPEALGEEAEATSPSPERSSAAKSHLGVAQVEFGEAGELRDARVQRRHRVPGQAQEAQRPHAPESGGPPCGGADD